MKTNSYPTHCITCHEQKPAGHGKLTKVHGKWVCDCQGGGERWHKPIDDDPYDAIKDGMLEDGSWYNRR
jgi:hypothetical protein